MSDADQVNQAIAELWDIVKCRCHEAYTGRGLHDPDCQCDSTDAVKTVADRIEALTEQRDAARQDAKEAEAYAEELEAKLATCEKYRDAYDEMGRIGTQAVRDLEAKLALMVFERDEVIKFERDEAWKRAAHLEKMWGEAEAKLAECEARLGKAVEALKNLTDCVDLGCFCSEMQMASAMDTACAALAEIKGLNKGESHD